MLSGPPPTLPTGLVFACFMLCITLGGQLFEISVQTKVLTEHVAVSPAPRGAYPQCGLPNAPLLRVGYCLSSVWRTFTPLFGACVGAQVLVCLAACVAMTACSVFPERFDVVFGSFLLLELSVGSSYAAYATLRARVIPEVPCATDCVSIARHSHIAQYLLLPNCVAQGQRATVTNLFRVPLNICVVAGTKLTDKYSPAYCFPVVAAWFGVATVCQVRCTCGSFAASLKCLSQACV